MRVWDIHPGYLNGQSLLGEHRELHGLVAVLRRGSGGYASHPETLRWSGCGWALRRRHAVLAAEMAFRGYRDRTPVRTRSAPGRWPAHFVDPPGRQFALLAAKYEHREPGRIPLPGSTQELWAQHKYSVLARDQAAYRALGRRIAGRRGRDGFEELARELTAWLRRPPAAGELRNALDHMWGHLPREARDGPKPDTERALLARIQRGIRGEECAWLRSQTALTELDAW